MEYILVRNVLPKAIRILKTGGVTPQAAND
jgi:hypothetical protein